MSPEIFAFVIVPSIAAASAVGGLAIIRFTAPVAQPWPTWSYARRTFLAYLVLWLGSGIAAVAAIVMYFRPTIGALITIPVVSCLAFAGDCYRRRATIRVADDRR